VIAFADFLRAAYRDPKREPYPWQRRFAKLCATGSPPPLVGVPTGCGKTTAVDALVWALAFQADLPRATRTIGARIVWAIDRRILVDEVHAHATALAGRLLGARDRADDPLHEIAMRLSALSGDVPLQATRWRGGVASDRSLHPPTQAQVITSTVAQIGSRLLFRGYGVGRRSLSMAAGLAACDTTICLDEAHLAEPFRQTVGAIRSRRRETEEGLDLPALGIITLTATPSAREPDAIRLDDGDRQVPALRQRLHGEKWAQLEDAPATERERVKLIAERASGYIDEGAPTVACVVNTVKRAREVFDSLARMIDDDETDLALLVGPQRPADREFLLGRQGDLLFGRDTSDRPLVCVATQTFEVGLDADVAAMITDSASASALVQRLGRLNRRGLETGRATIVRDESSWLYEADEPLAWSWLLARERDGVVDVSVAALEADRSRPLPRRVRSAPSLTPGAIDLLVQTNPQPGRWQEPSVEGFLRGAEDRTVTDVTVCWRCDLLPTVDDPAAEGYREMLLKLVPPQDRELLTLSVKGARALLAALYADPGGAARAAKMAASDVDVEGESEPGTFPSLDFPGPDSTGVAAPFLVVRGGDILHGTVSGPSNGRVAASSLQPGDTVVLPTEKGGVDGHGLAPGAARNDKLADVAGDRRRRSDSETRLSAPVPVRISRAALGEEHQGQWPQIRQRCRAHTDGEGGDATRAVERLVNDLARLLPDHEALSMLTQQALSEHEPLVRVLVRAIGAVDEDGLPTLDVDEIEALQDEDGGGVEHGDASANGEAVTQALSAPPAVPRRDADVLERTWVLLPAADRERERRRRDSANPPPTLEEHAIAVRTQVEEFTAGSGLPEPILSALSLAAAAHDHGKADSRMQAFFHGGVRPLGSDPIAKSVFGTEDPRAERMARTTAGLPRGLSHEVASVAVLAEWLAAGGEPDAAIDHDLVLHLAGTHHGQGRPIPRPPAGGEEALAFYVDAVGIQGTAIGDGQDGWADGAWLQRFWRVIDRYGEWGTAYLEALLMLADRNVSARGL